MAYPDLGFAGDQGLRLRNRTIPRAPLAAARRAQRSPRRRSPSEGANSVFSQVQARSEMSAVSRSSGNLPPLRPPSAPGAATRSTSALPTTGAPPPLREISTQEVIREMPDPAIRDLQEENEELRERLADLEGLVRRVTNSVANMGSSALVPYMPQQMVQAPPPFTGHNPRSWLLQIEQFFNLTRVPEAERLDRIVCHLGGKALEYYSATNERMPELMPRTWQEFKTFLIKTFGAISVISVITKIRAIKFKGDFNEVVDKFHEALASGEQPTEKHLVGLFLTRFPWELSRGARGKHFNTWIEARHFMEQEYKDWAQYALEYNLEAHEDFRRSMRQDAIVQAQGLFGPPQRDKNEQQFNRGQQSGNNNNRFDNRARRGSQNGEKKENGTENANANNGNASKGPMKCFVCSGFGHKGKECPSTNPITRREGQRCNKCTGMGHWRSACPTRSQEKTARTVPEAAGTTQGAQAQTGNGQA